MKEKSTYILTAIFIAVDVLFVYIAASFQVGYMVASFLLPISMGTIAARRSIKEAIVATGVVLLCVSMIVGGYFALGIFALLVMGLLVSSQIEAKEELFFTSMIASCASVVTLVNLYLVTDVYHIVNGTEIVKLMKAIFLAVFSQSMKGTDLTVFVDALVTLVPSAVVGAHFIVGFICTLIIAKIYKKAGRMTNIQPFSRFILTTGVARMTVFLSVTLLLISLFQDGGTIVLANGASFLTTIASVAGIAGLVGIAKVRSSKRMPILLGTLVLYMFAGGSVFYMYGIVDAFLDFRGVRKNENTE